MFSLHLLVICTAGALSLSVCVCLYCGLKLNLAFAGAMQACRCLGLRTHVECWQGFWGRFRLFMGGGGRIHHPHEAAWVGSSEPVQRRLGMTSIGKHKNKTMHIHSHRAKRLEQSGSKRAQWRKLFAHLLRNFSFRRFF